MTPAVLDNAEETARLMLQAIAYIRAHHPLQQDNRGVLHFQPGPACASLRIISQTVSSAMVALRASAASPPPPAPGLPRARR